VAAIWTQPTGPSGRLLGIRDFAAVLALAVGLEDNGAGVAAPLRAVVLDGTVVVAALGETVSVETAIELVRVGEQLIRVADSECIGPGTHRTAIAGASVYAADRLTAGKSVTQADVIEAASTVVPTSKHQIRSYSREIHDGAEGRLTPDDAKAGLVQAD
jgi:transcription initiation factor TFIIB